MFIGRRLDGTIYGLWTVRQPDDADHPRMEEVADDNLEVKLFTAACVRTVPLDKAVWLLETAKRWKQTYIDRGEEVPPSFDKTIAEIKNRITALGETNVDRTKN